MDERDLRHRVRLESFEPLPDSNGDPQRGPQGEVLSDWTLVATLWAAIEPLSARDFIQSGASQSSVSTRITIRYRSGVTAAMRVVHGSKIYNIAGVLPDKDSGLEYLTLPCSEGANSGE